MKQLPIIFNTEMVQAILDGRKTQTRRVIKPQPIPPPDRIEWYGEDIGGWLPTSNSGKVGIFEPGSYKCPYGKPGDMLYVRETWMPSGWSMDGSDWCINYKANGPAGQIVPHLYEDMQKEEEFWIKVSDELHEAGCPEVDGMFEDITAYMSWKPSIYMPKNAARIWLQVNDIRVERVQGISENESIFEGVKYNYNEWARDAFKDLWNSINKKRGFGWDENPWVWVVEFEVISTMGKPGIL